MRKAHERTYIQLLLIHIEAWQHLHNIVKQFSFPPKKPPPTQHLSTLLSQNADSSSMLTKPQSFQSDWIMPQYMNWGDIFC